MNVLGQGKFGEVVVVRHRVGSRKRALKSFSTKSMSREALDMAMEEVEVSLALDHPNIVRLHDVYEIGHEAVHMVMECCTGGELYYYLLDKGRLPEPQVAELTEQMVSAVAYMHARGVVHRDIKLDNFLFADDTHRWLKLVDFGFATVLDDTMQMSRRCGTRGYVSPEVLLGDSYTSKCDMWSLGVVNFMLLTGLPPIDTAWNGIDDAGVDGGDNEDDNDERVEELQKTMQGEVSWNDLADVPDLSNEAADFARALLTRNPQDRIDAQAACFHPWLLKTRQALFPSAATLTETVLRSIDYYAKGPGLRRAALQLLARELPAGQADELTQLFTALCRGSGHHGSIDLQHLEASGVQPLSLSSLDANGDGQVYYSDFLAATMWSLQSPHQEEALRAVFYRLDDDGDGAITQEDLRSVLWGLPFEGSQAEELLAEVGIIDAQGALGFEAFLKIFAEDRNEIM